MYSLSGKTDQKYWQFIFPAGVYEHVCKRIPTTLQAHFILHPWNIRIQHVLHTRTVRTWIQRTPLGVALHGIYVSLICLFTVLAEYQSHNVGITLHGCALVKMCAGWKQVVYIFLIISHMSSEINTWQRKSSLNHSLLKRKGQDKEKMLIKHWG